MLTHFDKVGEFHDKFMLQVYRPGTRPKLLSHEDFLYRYDFLQEELHELMRAHRAGDIYEVADALADLVYVAAGTAHLYGIPFNEVFDEVHSANMRKERSKLNDSRSKRKSSLDVVKPEGWQPPNIKAIIDGEGDVS